MTKTTEFYRYRASYLRALAQEVFPWEAAYYYYVETSENIDVFPFEDFKNSVLNESIEAGTDLFGDFDRDKAFEAVSAPIYDKLEEFFGLVYLLDQKGQLLKVY